MASTQEQTQQQQPKQLKFTKLSDIRPNSRDGFNSLVKIIEVQEKQGKREDVVILEGFCADETRYLPFRITANTNETNKTSLTAGKFYNFLNYQAEVYGKLLKINLIQTWSQVQPSEQTIENVQEYYQLNKISDINKDIESGDIKDSRKFYNVLAKIGHIEERKPLGNRQQEQQDDKQISQKEENRKQYEGWCGDETGKINFRIQGQSAKLCQVGSTVLFAECIVAYKDDEVPKITGRVLETSKKIGDINTSNDISISQENTQYKRTEIKDLELGQNGYNVQAKILTANKTTEKVGRNNREIDVVRGQCGDSTGVINYLVRGIYANVIEANKTVLFVNIKSEVDPTEETHRILSGIKGRVIGGQSAIEQVNTQNDKSKQKWEKVVLDDKPTNRNRNQGRGQPRGPRRGNSRGPRQGGDRQNFNNNNNRRRYNNNGPRDRDDNRRRSPDYNNNNDNRRGFSGRRGGNRSQSPQQNDYNNRNSNRGPRNQQGGDRNRRNNYDDRRRGNSRSQQQGQNRRSYNGQRN